MSDAVLRVRIDGIAAGGAGVGRTPDGRAVFVHRTAPGELADVELVEAKRRWARGRLVVLQEASPARRDAPCRFYERCGGCTLEHLQYEAQLAAKSQIVVDALKRIGHRAIEPPEVVPSPSEFRYRNRVSFTLVRLRTGGVLAGFHEIDRPDRVLDVDGTCLLPEQPVADAWGSLRVHWGRNATRLPAGSRLRLTLRGTAGGRTALLVQGGFGPGQPDELLARVPSLDAVWHQPRPNVEPLLLAGEARLAESWQEEELALGGAVFLQVNRGAAALLEDHVVDLAGDVRGRTVIDAYCGVGLHARRFARAGARVTGVELDPLAVHEAELAAPDVRFVHDRVESALPPLLPVDLVVLNPPRSGLAAEAVAALRAAPPDRMIYVSCDPATLARDLDRLGGTFTLGSVRCFDLFPQTAHVETVAEIRCYTT
jgi:23S rRNA (uracil1939-C5)-methyltransferase